MSSIQTEILDPVTHPKLTLTEIPDLVTHPRVS